MKTSHTPGPWSHRKDGLPELKNQNNIIDTANGEIIVYGQANDEDARLISAAPDLLEALRLCSVRFKQYTDHHLSNGNEEKAASNALMLKLCETVIAKATGGGV